MWNVGISRYNQQENNFIKKNGWRFDKRLTDPKQMSLEECVGGLSGEGLFKGNV